MKTRPCLTSADAKKMIAACLETAIRNKWEVTIAVVDEHGVLLQFERMDGATFVSAEVAVAKARTAAIWRRSTKVWESNVKERPGLINMPNNLPVQGGVPIIYEGECVGGVGVSGARSHEDEEVAHAGLAAIGLSPAPG